MPDRDRIVQEEMDERLTCRLETAPQVVMPAEFAARVFAEAARRFGQDPAADRGTRFGAYAIWVSAGVLLAAMLLLASFFRTSPMVGFGLEAMLGAEFILLAIYLGLRPLAWR